MCVGGVLPRETTPVCVCLASFPGICQGFAACSSVTIFQGGARERGNEANLCLVPSLASFPGHSPLFGGEWPGDEANSSLPDLNLDLDSWLELFF